MPTFYGYVDLSKNELRNAVVQNLGSAPGSPVKGQIYLNTSDNTLYFYDGTAFVSTRAVGALTPAATVTTQSFSDAGQVGSSVNYAREDHKHVFPGFYASVVPEQTFGIAANNGGASQPARGDHTHGTPTHDSTAHAGIPLNALGAANGSVNLNNNLLTNVLTPVSGTDAANKNYVDNSVAGLSWKESVRVASTANLALSGLVAVDGVTVASGDRVLAKNQTTQSQCGIYLAGSGAWTRSTDADAAAELNGMATYVEEGSTLAGTAWVLTTDPPITIGTTSLVYAQFGGGQIYVGGAGLLLTGATFDVQAADTSITVTADAIAVNTAVIAARTYVDTAVTGMAKKFAAALTGTASPETVTHNLNTRDIHLTVLNGATPYTAVEVDWDATTVNTATVRYSPNLGAGYRCVVIG